MKVLIFLVFQNYIFAQNLFFSAKADSSKIFIGSTTKINLSLKSSDSSKISWERLKDSIGKIIILEKSELVKSNGEEKLSILITIFEEGKYNFQIPAFKIVKNETTAIFSNSLNLLVKPIEIDTSKSFKDIKKPKSLPISLEEILFWILIVLLLIGLIFLIKFLLKKFKKKKSDRIEEEIKIPPFDLAMKKLEEIENEKIWQNGNLKKYYSEVTFVVREYFENEYNILAIELTTAEFISLLKINHFENNIIEKIKNNFELADLVKFAKHNSLLRENETFIINAREIIQLTKNNVDTIRK